MGRRKAIVEGTPANTAKAVDFLEWFALEREKIEHYVRGGLGYDEDMVSEAMIRCYDTIVRRGTRVDDYMAYFLSAYRSTYLDAVRAKGRRTLQVEQVRDLASPDFDSEAYEHRTEQRRKEVVGYVRDNYSEFEVSIFEIYVGLLPDISYKRLSAILGIPAAKIWPVVGRIKKDLAEQFGAEYSVNSGVQ